MRGVGWQLSEMQGSHALALPVAVCHRHPCALLMTAAHPMTNACPAPANPNSIPGGERFQLYAYDWCLQHHRHHHTWMGAQGAGG